MTRVLNVDGLLIAVHGAARQPLLSAFCERHDLTDGAAELTISSAQQGLQCIWHTAPTGPLNYWIDVEKFARQWYSYPAPKQGAFNQALGKKSRFVIDATAGWGNDALLMCAQGYQVTLLERNPVMALMLTDAMHRLGACEWAIDNQIPAPRVIEADAIEYLNSGEVTADCIYLDPMFPAKRKKSAAVNKNMQFLQWLVGENHDARELANSAFHSGCPRVVVKRPDYAQPLLDAPAERFSGKLVHYDVYLRARS